MTGILYLVPNTLVPPELADDALLASSIPIEVQRRTASLDYFIAENAKTTRAFLKLVNRQTPLSHPLQSILINELNVNTPATALAALLEPLLGGRNAGLISEAGAPAVADPGADLVRLAHVHGVPVQPLVGPSSILLAVMASGLSGQSFAFNGYLPIDGAQRQKRIKVLEERSRQEQQTQLFIETPYRNQACLEALVSNCAASTLICVATNLSAASERIETRTAAQWKTVIGSSRQQEIHKQPTVFLLLAN